MTDLIADMLTRIRNAYKAGHKTVQIPYSKIKLQIIDILKSEGYIKEYETEKKKYPQINLTLTYKQKLPAIEGLKRVSKPGRRVYARAGKIPKTLGGVGLTIISTSKGVMTDSQTSKEKMGGEIICQVW